MIDVTDVLYLLDVGGEPLRSIKERYDLRVDHIIDESSTLYVEVPLYENIKVEQQFVYRGNRYKISEIDDSRAELSQKITADIIYLELNTADLCTFKMTGATLEKIASEALKNTRWTVKSVAVNLDSHSVNVEEKTPLYVLRLLATLSGLRLVFDTLNFTVSFVADDSSNLEFLFKYRKNLQDFTRRTYAPKATVIVPYGRDGMTIESINDGMNYVENFDYYLEQGYTIEEARERFTKVATFTDERFIYPGNLKKEAEKRLDLLSKPQVAYDVKVSDIGKNIKIGDYGYVDDEDLGQAVVHVVRYVEHEDDTKSSVELNYLIPGLAEMTDRSEMSGGSGGLSTALVDNNRAVEVTTNYTEVVQLSLSLTAPTHVAGNFKAVGTKRQQGLIEAIMDINGQPLMDTFRGTFIEGEQTVVLPFVATQVQEGSHILRVMMKVDKGSFVIDKQNARMFVHAENLAGGMSTELPKINVAEEVTFPVWLSVTESVNISQQEPTQNGVNESVEFPRGFDVQEECTIELF